LPVLPAAHIFVTPVPHLLVEHRSNCRSVRANSVSYVSRRSISFAVAEHTPHLRRLHQPLRRQRTNRLRSSSTSYSDTARPAGPAATRSPPPSTPESQKAFPARNASLCAALVSLKLNVLVLRANRTASSTAPAADSHSHQLHCPWSIVCAPRCYTNPSANGCSGAQPHRGTSPSSTRQSLHANSLSPPSSISPRHAPASVRSRGRLVERPPKPPKAQRKIPCSVSAHSALVPQPLRRLRQVQAAPRPSESGRPNSNRSLSSSNCVFSPSGPHRQPAPAELRRPADRRPHCPSRSKPRPAPLHHRSMPPPPGSPNLTPHKPHLNWPAASPCAAATPILSCFCCLMAFHSEFQMADDNTILPSLESSEVESSAARLRLVRHSLTEPNSP